MKALVTGANGMLGSALCPLLKKNGYEVIATDISLPGAPAGGTVLNVRDLQGARSCVAKVKPDIIFHLAAETDVDKCETDADHAFLTNTLGTENMALICQEFDIPMAYISTCGVFDGKKLAPYNEFDTPNPVNVYARTKLEGEKAVASLLRRYYIFRAGWMIGGGKRDKKFVAKIVELLKTRTTLTVVNDKRGCPTFTKDFSECILKIVKLGRYGLYHVTNRGDASRYDIACRIVEFLQMKNVTITPVTSDRFPLPAARPDSEAVDNYKLKLLGIDTPGWDEALREYLKELA